MPRRDTALIDRLRRQLAHAQRLTTKPGTSGPEKRGFSERPWRDDADALIVSVTFRAIEVRYVIREAPDSRKVRATHAYVFDSSLTRQALYDWLISLR
jgi:hypothetical protein